jgi:hypothetical protein
LYKEKERKELKGADIPKMERIPFEEIRKIVKNF